MPKTANLLVIDDDPADIDLLVDYLEDAPFKANITTAKDGVEGLEILAAGPIPDLIVLDLNMPRMNGFETLEKIRAQDGLKDIKVIVLTTSGDDDHIMKSFDMKANYFVTKPSLPHEFEAVVQLMMDFLKAYVWKE